MIKAHTLTPDEKLEVQSIIAIYEKAKGLYGLTQELLEKAKATIGTGQAPTLFRQALECEVEAVEKEREALEAEAKLLEGLAKSEGWEWKDKGCQSKNTSR